MGIQKPITNYLRISKDGKLSFGTNRGCHVLDIFESRERNWYFRWLCVHVRGFREEALPWVRHAYEVGEVEKNNALDNWAIEPEDLLQARMDLEFPGYVIEHVPLFDPEASKNTPQALAAAQSQEAFSPKDEQTKPATVQISAKALNSAKTCFSEKWQSERLGTETFVGWFLRGYSEAIRDEIPDADGKIRLNEMVITSERRRNTIYVTDIQREDPGGSRWF